MKNIFDEYENFLQSIINCEGKYLNFSKLIEERGTNYDEFKIIINTIQTSLWYAQHIKENNYDTLLSKDIIIDGAFLKKPTLKIIWNKNSKDYGFVRLGNAYYDKHEKQLCNVIIFYYESVEEYPNYNKDKLNELLWHELQHTYRQFFILKKECETELKNKKEQYYKNLYVTRDTDDTINRVIKNTLYYTDRNEINSHLNEMIPYLEKHKEINFKNYKNYLNEIPGYNIINYLKQYAEIYNNPIMFNDNNFTEKIGKVIYDKLYKNNGYNAHTLSPRECVKRLRRKINFSVIYAQKQFYKILSYTLDKLCRESIYRQKDRFSNDFYNIFNDYKNLLNS